MVEIISAVISVLFIEPDRVTAFYAVNSTPTAYPSNPWHFLYFLPDPHGHGSLRPTLSPVRRWATSFPPLLPAMRACSSSRFFLRWNSASIWSMVVDG